MDAIDEKLLVVAIRHGGFSFLPVLWWRDRYPDYTKYITYIGTSILSSKPTQTTCKIQKLENY